MQAQQSSPRLTCRNPTLACKHALHTPMETPTRPWWWQSCHRPLCHQQDPLEPREPSLGCQQSPVPLQPSWIISNFASTASSCVLQSRRTGQASCTGLVGNQDPRPSPQGRLHTLKQTRAEPHRELCTAPELSSMDNTHPWRGYTKAYLHLTWGDTPALTTKLSQIGPLTF